MQTQQIPLSQLKPDPANVRRTGLKPTEQFLASVREEGILEPLSVRPNGGSYLVTNGGKRLAALAILVKDKTIPADHPVPCVVRDGDEKAARNISLAVNYHREGMHPVDEFEAFAEMQKDGMSASDIQRKYGLTKREVDQVLALGGLAPIIREAWRKDEIDEEAARAFTLEADQKRQSELFGKLRKSRGLNHWTVRSAIVGEDRHLPGMVQFVGLDAYKAAGGTAAMDLFSGDKEPSEAITDIQLMKKLYDEKLQAKIAELKAEGWKWVEFERDLGHSAQFWEAMGKKAVKAEERANYGVIVSIDYQGRVEFRYGVQKPVQKRAEDRKEASKGGNTSSSAISAALAGRLNEQITTAVAAVLEKDSRIGLVAACAAMTSGHDGSVAITSHTTATAKFLTQFEIMRKKSAAELHDVIAKVAAESLSIGGSVQDRLPLSKNRPGDRALLESLDGKKLNAALRASFDPKDYFAGVTAQACKDAISLCDPKYPFTGKEKKSELAKLAADLVKKSNAGGKAGYLPPEMRTAHYDGPAAAKEPKKAPAKKAAKTAK